MRRDLSKVTQKSRENKISLLALSLIRTHSHHDHRPLWSMHEDTTRKEHQRCTVVAHSLAPSATGDRQLWGHCHHWGALGMHCGPVRVWKLQPTDQIQPPPVPENKAWLKHGHNHLSTGCLTRSHTTAQGSADASEISGSQSLRH